ncbi:hypothetical protein ACWHLZ_18105 [Streptomyces chartreusis]|nr:hypothetical protein OG938_00995 [Streptomyces chartreusis]
MATPGEIIPLVTLTYELAARGCLFCGSGLRAEFPVWLAVATARRRHPQL